MASLILEFAKHVSQMQVLDSNGEITPEEIKRLVWDFGSEKSPGLNGFDFEFIQWFWSLDSNDVVNVVLEFFSSCFFPWKCNPSFSALILKVTYAKFVKDYCLISFTSCQYKIVRNCLANRLSLIMGGSCYPIAVDLY